MVASPAPSTRLARAVNQRRMQRKNEQSPVKQQQEKSTISTATTGADASKASSTKNWWVQGGLGSNSTDDMTVSSQSVVSNTSSGTGTSNLSAAANRRRLRKAQKDANQNNKASALNVSISSQGVPRTVETPTGSSSASSIRRVNSSSSIFSLAQKRVSGSDATITNSNASIAAVSSPLPLTNLIHNSRPASNRFMKMSEAHGQLQRDAKLYEQKALFATEAKENAEKEKNEAISFMENQIHHLQETLRAVTEQMGMVQINEQEQAMHEKQLIDSQTTVAVLRKQLQQMSVINETLVEKVNNATHSERVVAELSTELARTKSEHATVVESLRMDLASAKQMSMKNENDFEVLKQNHAKEVTFHKKEIEGFKEQLKIAMKMGESDRSGIKDIERKLAECEKAKAGLAKQLKQAQDASTRLKADGERDTQLLESELDKALKEKTNVERELQETKCQLSSALENLDEMTLEGGKMQNNVEGMMANFTKEKEKLQNEISALKREREEKVALAEDLRREKIAVDIDSKNLQQNVRDLEMKLRGAEKFISDLETEVKCLNDKQPQNAPEQAITEIVNVNQLRADKASLQSQLDSKEKSVMDLRRSNREVSMQLSKAQQTIHKLQSKEKYLENRVECLSNQISKTVHDYEMKLVNYERN